MEDTNLASLLSPESDFAPETPPAIAELTGDISDLVNATTSEDTDKQPMSAEAQESVVSTDSGANYQELVDSLGGVEVVESLKTLLADDSANLAQILPPDQIESLLWTALDNQATQQVILNDPDVRQALSDLLFDGRDLDEVAELSRYFGQEVDPNVLAQRQQEYVAAQQHEAQVSHDLEKRFFVDTEEDIAGRFGLTDPDAAEIRNDIRLAAQAKFLNENAEAYLKLQAMLAQGNSVAAQVAEARLNNKWQATLIKTAERLGKVRPQAPLTKPKEKPEAKVESYDLSSDTFLQDVLRDFRASRKERGL